MSKFFCRHSAGLLFCLALLLALPGCAPRERRPLTFDQQQALMAHAQCRREASEMNPEWRGDSSYFPWRAYYNMCMRRLGAGDEELRGVWR